MEETDYAIIVAGGKGTRMGAAEPKQFLPVGGRPALMRTLERFREFSTALQIIVVLPHGEQERWRRLCAEHRFTVAHRVADGGATRFESSRNGLAAIPDGTRGLVAIHDGVRPFVPREVIARCFEAARRTGAAIPVCPVTDTLRRVEANGGGHNVPRADSRIVQTPQVFDIALARRAFSQPESDRFTDDASVVEALGHPVAMVEGSRMNIKLTTPFDLMVAEALASSASS